MCLRFYFPIQSPKKLSNPQNVFHVLMQLFNCELVNCKIYYFKVASKGKLKETSLVIFKLFSCEIYWTIMYKTNYVNVICD